MKLTGYGFVVVLGLVFCAVGMGGFAAAQQEGDAQKEMQEKFAQLMSLYVDKLDLSKEEEQQVRPIFLENFQKQRELRLQYRAAKREQRRDLRKQMRDRWKNTREGLSAILPGKRLRNLGKVRQEVRKQMREQFKGRYLDIDDEE
ncbi:hypothetical protein ACFL43_02850 [Thermodesulfobacteriota bacterium]